MEEEQSSEVYDWLQTIVSALLVSILILSFFFRTIRVIGPSMQPSFYDADRVIISSMFYEPKQGDVVIVRKLAFQEDPIIKRVIAVGGQTVKIDFQQGIVYVDGKALDEQYIAAPTHNALDFRGEVTVPENCVFIMGDNRNDSTDSRYSIIGCVDKRYILGKVLFRYYPLNKFGAINKVQ